MLDSVIPTGYSQGGALFSTKPSSLREIQIECFLTHLQFHNTKNLCVGVFGVDSVGLQRNVSNC